MATVYPWTITQLGGDKKILTLSMGQAPHGRPRKDPIVKDGVKVNTTRTHYPDSQSSRSTRHVFGEELTDWELKGRFRAKDFANPEALQTRVQEIKKFISDHQEVSASWGPVLAIEGFLKTAEFEWESSAECTWKLVLEIDADITKPVSAAANKEPAKVNPRLIEKAIEELGVAVTLAEKKEFKPSLFDAVDDLVSGLTGAAGSLLSTSKSITDTINTPAAQWKRLRAGLHQTRVASLRVKRCLETNADQAGLDTSAVKQITGLLFLADYKLQCMLNVEILAEAERDAVLLERGQTSTMYAARFGDSWESISRKFYNGAEGADRIRLANGIRTGTAPEPGKRYRIPAVT